MSCVVEEAEVLIPLPQPSKCWDSRVHAHTQLILLFQGFQPSRPVDNLAQVDRHTEP